MQPPAFPTHWDYRRVLEVLVAAYATALGLTLMIVPETLAASHYRGFGGPDGAWMLGLTVLMAATLHSWSLWLNGSAPRLSTLIRKIACGSHMAVNIFFAIEFARQGVYWGTIIMCLILTMIYLAMHRAFDPFPRGGGMNGRHKSG